MTTSHPSSNAGTRLANACVGHASELPGAVALPLVPRPTALSAVILFCVSVLGGLALVLKEPMLLLCAGAVAGLLLAGMLHPRPSHLHLDLHGPNVLEAGRPLEFRVVVTNAGNRPTPAMQVSVAVPQMAPFNAHVDPLLPGTAGASRFVRTPLYRGVSTHAELRVEVADSLGLTQRVLSGRLVWPVVVHPPTVAPEIVESCGGEDVEAAVTTYVPGAEFAGTRPWRRGDNRRQIHWRSTARHGQLVVVERVAAPARGLVVVLVGTAKSYDDELRWATAAATTARALREREPTDVLARRPQGWDSAPNSIKATLDWFADLGEVSIPSVEDIVAQIPPGTGRVAVAASDEVAPGWIPALRAALGGTVVHSLAPAALSPEQMAAFAKDHAMLDGSAAALQAQRVVSS